MKKSILALALLLLVSTACKKENNPLNKVKEATNKLKEAKQGLGNINELLKGAEGLQDHIKKLSETTPITKAELKAWMPEQLDDLRRSSFQISKDMGTICKLVFKDDNKKSMNINIVDGAGNGAPMISMYSMMQNMDIDKENNTGYERTQKMGDQKVYVKYQKSGNYESSKLQCTLNGRFGIEANAKSMTPDELWKYIEKLEIQKLIIKI